jgi:hypothetical protein
MVHSFVALLCAGIALFLLAHYPLPGVLPGALWLLLAGLCATWPSLWLIALPALLPVVALAPWTGWIAIDELDLIVLAIASGAYARLAWPMRPVPPDGAEGVSLVGVVLVVLYGTLLALSAARGVIDAGGPHFGWFQGYREAANSVRLAKGIVLAGLLWPLWRQAQKASPLPAASHWMLGMSLGLAAASLAAIWERFAFVGLLDFSTDYRTTALFWEMHVGGAALDAYLALGLPFAVVLALGPDSAARRAVAVAALPLAAYAGLTTFSRIVYLALPVGVAVACAARALQRRRKKLAVLPSTGSLAGGAVMLVAFAAAATWMFPSSGYRGLLALFGASVALLPLVPALAAASQRPWRLGIVGGALLAGLAVVFAGLVEKGAYLACGVCFVVTSGALAMRAAGGSQRFASLALAGYIGTLAGMALVGRHWGGEPALTAALAVALVWLLPVFAPHRVARAWPRGAAGQGGAALALALAGAVVAILSGGGYLSERFAGTGDDLSGRAAHWRHSLEMLHSAPDWLLGIGLGRYPDHYALAAPDAETPGDYRRVADGATHHLVLSAGDKPQGWGELLRLSQRIAVPEGPLRLALDLRTERAVQLHVEVCEKHLLYSQNCVSAVVVSQARPGAWQHVELPLEGRPPSGGAWYAPRFIVFSMAVESQGQRAEIDHVALTTPGGSDLLHNGDFSDGLAHWFLSSDRNHFPWHAKSLLLQTLVEQGIVGAALLCLVAAGALWRLLAGALRDHPLAPAAAGALVGFGTVGLIDDPLEVPRLAFVFSLLLLFALLTAGPRAAGTARPTRRQWPGRSGASAAALLVIAGLAGSDPARADAEPALRTLQVGPTRAIKTLADAARRATDGTQVDVDAGIYRADVAVWPQNDLSLKASGGRVRLLADGAAAEGKAIWVVRGRNVKVAGFDFEGARVPDLNGAGIRLESGTLHVIDCRFFDDESGILTSNDPSVELRVDDSEFARQRRADGRNHHLYAGAIRSLVVSGSYFHDAAGGHLIKSRAASSRIEYNRLADGASGHASYELELPSGGVGVVIGNLIQQGPLSENPHMLSYGTEDYRWHDNRLYVAYNTFVDELGQAADTFIRVRPGAMRVRLVGNLFAGPATLAAGAAADLRNNLMLALGELQDAAAGDYRLKRPPRGWARAGADEAATATDPALTPQRQYQDPRHTVARTAPPRLPGALQPEPARH